MNKSKHEKNQIFLFVSALVLALAIIITAAYFIARAIEGNDTMQRDNDIYLHKNSSKEDDSNLSNIDSQIEIEESSKVDEDSQENEENEDNEDIVKPVELRTAQSYIDYNTTDLITEFNDEYETLGYFEGGYFIYNFDVIPNLYFSVANDGNGKLINDKLQAIMVNKNGYIYDEVMVGMTYDELKLLCGNSMTITMGDENTCQEVVIETNKIIAYVQFDIETNCSNIATVKFK